MDDAVGAGTGSSQEGVGPDPAAIALALGSADPQNANRFLDEQTALARDQRHLVDLQARELSHELGLRHWSLWVSHCSGLLKLTLEVGLAVAAIALACFLAAAVWNAAHADGLVIESFSVPPDLAARGLTGQVIAGKTLDELLTLQNANPSIRAAKTYADNWGDDIKVEIPETGISVGEAYRFLRRWLGHETHIGGEVWRTAGGLGITARVSQQTGVTVTGVEDNLDPLIHSLAERIYRQTQPYRYAAYLASHFRNAEAAAVGQDLALHGPPQERPWGYVAWANALVNVDLRAPPALLERALALQPDNVLALNNLANARYWRGQVESAILLQRHLLEVLRGGANSYIESSNIARMRDQGEGVLALYFGDDQTATRNLARILQEYGRGGLSDPNWLLARAWLQGHELPTARKILRGDGDGPQSPSNQLAKLSDLLLLHAAQGDWAGLLTSAKEEETWLKANRGQRPYYETVDLPQIAYARAKLGDRAGAEQTIRRTPADCYPCLIARGRIAAVEQRPGPADYWFARAAAVGPSVPMADTEWGKALLERGDLDSAIAKFQTAHRKSPHFADALVYWGEALTAKNQSHLAVAKFAEAEKYAPNWGRLHLKWGEALGYAGKKDAAKVQFARAAQLDLTPSDKAELARMR